MIQNSPPNSWNSALELHLHLDNQFAASSQVGPESSILVDGQRDVPALSTQPQLQVCSQPLAAPKARGLLLIR